MDMDKTVKLDIIGMTCDGCRETVQKALNSSDSVCHAKVNLASKTAEVMLEDDGTIDQAIQAVKDSGYDAKKA